MAISNSRLILAGAAVAALAALGATTGIAGSVGGKLGLDAATAPSAVQPVNTDERRAPRDEHRARKGVTVDAPHTRVETDKGNVRIEAPYTSVERSSRGVRVRAPFVDVVVPR